MTAGPTAAGATLVNDVSASLGALAAALGPGIGFVAMHMLGDPRTMQDDPRYDDVVADVRGFLVDRAEAAAALGVFSCRAPISAVPAPPPPRRVPWCGSA